eukprot:TsM_000339100 transcript=TsM_000339100 gene=TsM_000339100
MKIHNNKSLFVLLAGFVRKSRKWCAFQKPLFSIGEPLFAANKRWRRSSCSNECESRFRYRLANISQLLGLFVFRLQCLVWLVFCCATLTVFNKYSSGSLVTNLNRVTVKTCSPLRLATPTATYLWRLNVVELEFDECHLSSSSPLCEALVWQAWWPYLAVMNARLAPS